ncbi:MAG TPA: DUF2207 domain-containing protein [Burkholderiales bacterium]
MLCLLLPGAAEAAERVLDFHSEIRVAADGVITVTEVIVVQAEGQRLRRGIQRDFPADYHDRNGARVIVPLEVLRVSRNGELERHTLEQAENGVRLVTGDRDSPLRYGRHTYEIRYRTARQVSFHGAHDELYWNVNGNDWILPLDNISAEVVLPKAVPAASLKAEAFTGPVGAQGRSYQAFTGTGAAAFRSTRPFQPREGMTISLTFPKGVVATPSLLQRAGWFLQANLALVAACASVPGLVLLLWMRRSRVRRNRTADASARGGGGSGG